MSRFADFTEIIGAPGRGKTTQLIKLLEYKTKVKNERALVIVPDQQEPAWYDYPTIYSDELEEKFKTDFTGVLVTVYEEGETFPFLYDQFKNKNLKKLNLVLDDPYYCEGRPDKEIVRILARKRQFGIDIFSNSHSYDQVPAIFFPYITIYGLGYTEAEIVNRRHHLGGDFNTHKRYREKINALAGMDKSKPNYYGFKYFRKNGDKI